MARVLVIAAHADDEVLGMGGTIARHTREGDSVDVAFMTDGVGSRDPGGHEAIDRARAARAATSILGARIVFSGQYPDNALDSVRFLDVVKTIEKLKTRTQPDFVYTHHVGDLNVDHVTTSRATLTAFRPQPHETYSEVRTFEVLSSSEWSVGTPFVPDTFIDVTATHGLLMAAYDAYEAEQRPDPHPRSRRALEMKVALRGREVGLEAAEAFCTVRRIVRVHAAERAADGSSS